MKWPLIVAGVVVSAGSMDLSGARQSLQGVPRFSAQSEVVVLHVTVKDRRGAYISDLSESAFQVLEEGRPQPIAFFSGEDAPVTVGLLVDNSGSMQHARTQVVAATKSFVAASHPQDEVFALTFNEYVRAVLPPEMPFTSDPDALASAMASALGARGRTALFQAVSDGLRYLRMGNHARQVLIVVGDGGDNASRVPFATVLTQAQASNAAIYAVGLIDPLEREADPGVLRRLSAATGGEAFFPDDEREIHRALDHIAEDIRHAYTIGYVPRPGGSTALRHLRVIVTPPDRRRVNVRTRTGYLREG